MFRNEAEIKAATKERHRAHAGDSGNPVLFFVKQKIQMRGTAGADQQLCTAKQGMGNTTTGKKQPADLHQASQRRWPGHGNPLLLQGYFAPQGVDDPQGLFFVSGSAIKQDGNLKLPFSVVYARGEGFRFINTAHCPDWRGGGGAGRRTPPPASLTII